MTTASHRRRQTRCTLRRILPTVLLLANACGGIESLEDQNLSEEQRLGSSELGLAMSRSDLARYWSPFIYQDTHRFSGNGGWEYKHDYITKFNFDGNYNGKDNYENLKYSWATMPAYVYYSISETVTHYFIGYYFFHANDPSAFPPHENDLEGIIIAVRKNGGTCTESGGCLVAMVTQAHGSLHQYGFPSGITAGTATLESGEPYPMLTLYGSYAGRDGRAGTTDDGYFGRHVKVYVEGRGHGTFACFHYDLAHGADHDCDTANGGNGIIYYHAKDAATDTPNPTTGGDGNYTKKYRYKLIPMEQCDVNQTCPEGTDRGLWAIRYWRNDNPQSPTNCDATKTCPFATWGHISGDGGDAAGIPWIWADGGTNTGDWLCDPAKLFDLQFDGTPFDSNFSHSYRHHPYWTHAVDVEAVLAKSSAPNNPDLVVRVGIYDPDHPDYTDGYTMVINEMHWKKNDALRSVWYSWRYGYYNARTDIRYGDTSRRYYACRKTTGTATYFEVSDGSSSLGSHGHWGTGDHLAGLDLGKAMLKFASYTNPANQSD